MTSVALTVLRAVVTIRYNGRAQGQAILRRINAKKGRCYLRLLSGPFSSDERMEKAFVEIESEMLFSPSILHELVSSTSEVWERSRDKFYIGAHQS